MSKWLRRKGLQGLSFNLSKCRKSHQHGGHLNIILAPQGGNLKKTIYKGSNTKGVIFMLKYNNPKEILEYFVT